MSDNTTPGSAVAPDRGNQPEVLREGGSRAVWALVDYWRARSETHHARVRAACGAVGAAEYLLDPSSCPASDADRLIRLREVITELRQELGLRSLNPGTGTSAGGSGGDDQAASSETAGGERA